MTALKLIRCWSATVTAHTMNSVWVMMGGARWFSCIKRAAYFLRKNYLWMNKLQVREQNQAIKRILCQTSHFNNFSTTPTFVYSANFGDANIVWNGRLFNAGVIYFRFTFSESEFRFPASVDTPAVLTTTEGSEIRPTPHWSKTQARPDSETE
jgi:hypothetical protein